MRALFLAAAVPLVITSAVAQSPDDSDIRSITRLFAAYQYYLQKGDPDKAQRNLASLYLVLKNIEFMKSRQEAEDLFARFTGVQTGIRTFFRSMEVVDRDGRMIELPKEPKKKSYTCTRDRDGTSYCSED